MFVSSLNSVTVEYVPRTGRCMIHGLQYSKLLDVVRFFGGAENDGHEIAGHENDGPNSRA